MLGTVSHFKWCYIHFAACGFLKTTLIQSINVRYICCDDHDCPARDSIRMHTQKCPTGMTLYQELPLFQTQVFVAALTKHRTIKFNADLCLMRSQTDVLVV